MGCGVSTSKKITKRFDEFESKQKTKTIYLQNQEITINLPKYGVGDYYAVEIPNKEYYYFEGRFKELVGKEITNYQTNIQYESKESFIASIYSNSSLRKHIIKVIRRKGIMHAYRWKTWYILAVSDNSFKIDPIDIEIRRQLFIMLNEKRDLEAEQIIDKDVIRTERHKELFADIHSVGNKQLYRVCKAIGLFFPQSSYIQGMNFISAFVLQVNGLDEFEAFNFIVCLWKKEKNLFYGIYQPYFPVLYFMIYAFNKSLANFHPKIHKVINKLSFPPELWIVKWFISFFTFALEKEYVLRIFDFIIINDVFGPVYVALAICDQLKSVFASENFALIAGLIQDKTQLSAKVDFRRFVKRLKALNFETKDKLILLNEYYSSLNEIEKSHFEPFYHKYKKHWNDNQMDYYNDFGFDTNCDDYDNIGVEKLSIIITSERVIGMFKTEAIRNGNLSDGRNGDVNSKVHKHPNSKGNGTLNGLVY